MGGVTRRPQAFGINPAAALLVLETDSGITGGFSTKLSRRRCHQADSAGTTSLS